MSERMFPILNDPMIKAIPWEAIGQHEEQAQRNHSQSLRRLAERGGLSPCEAVAVMMDQPWKRFAQPWARAKLMILVLDFERKKEATHE